MRNSLAEKIGWIWQNAEKCLIVLFLATFTLNVRKVFLTPFSFPGGEFNEYLTPSFSWADLLMLAVIIIYVTKKLYSQLLRLLSDKISLSNVIRFKSSVIQIYYGVSRKTLVLLLFLLWIGISIFWSQFKPIAFYRFLTFIEMFLFVSISVKLLKSYKWLRLALFALAINGLFQSILGIAQFIRNKSLGIHWLGESLLGPNIDGVAKIFIEGEKHIRAYGTFPHPNIMAGFLIIPILIILTELFKRLSDKANSDYKVSRGTINRIMPIWLTTSILAILAVGFLLTFSRSAFLGITIGILALLFYHKKSMLRRFRFVLISLALLIFLSTTYFLYSGKNIVSIFSTQSLQERIFYQNVSRETISSHPVIGIGAGQFVLDEYRKYPNLDGWQYQPVHNVYLLVFSELGIMGLILFLLWIFSILEWGSTENRNAGLLLTNDLYYCVIIYYLIILLFDHYFWDIKSGLMVFVGALLFFHLSRNLDLDKSPKK